ncbi:MAG: AraC family transcriptional regulator [Luteibacter sp.]
MEPTVPNAPDPRSPDTRLRTFTTGCGARLSAIGTTSDADVHGELALVPGLLMVAARAGARGLRIVGEPRPADDGASGMGTWVRTLAMPATLSVRGAVDAVVVNLPASVTGLPPCVGWDDIGATMQCADRVDDTLYALVGAALASAASDPFGMDVQRFVMRALVLHYIGAYLQGHGKLARHGAPLAEWQLRATEASVSNTIDATIRIDALAKVCRLSPAQFRRAFKHTTGTTPHRWLLQYRLERARDELLATDRSVTDIALLCGFADQSHLTRQFCAAYGTPPAQWRRKAHREEA